MEKTIYQQAISNFGMARQWDKLAEEAAELIQAIMKVKYDPSEASKNKVIEEIVDIQIVLEQLCPNLNQSRFSELREAKLNRLKTLINQP